MISSLSASNTSTESRSTKNILIIKTRLNTSLGATLFCKSLFLYVCPIFRKADENGESKILICLSKKILMSKYK